MLLRCQCRMSLGCMIAACYVVVVSAIVLESLQGDFGSFVIVLAFSAATGEIKTLMT